MLTLEQARKNIDEVLRTVRNPALTREEHDLLRMSLEVLYDGAKENQESRQAKKDGAIDAVLDRAYEGDTAVYTLEDGRPVDGLEEDTNEPQVGSDTNTGE